jgi:hypothetical protein
MTNESEESDGLDGNVAEERAARQPTINGDMSDDTGGGDADVHEVDVRCDQTLALLRSPMSYLTFVCNGLQGLSPPTSDNETSTPDSSKKRKSMGTDLNPSKIAAQHRFKTWFYNRKGNEPRPVSLFCKRTSSKEGSPDEAAGA